MKRKQFFKATGTITACVVIILAGASRRAFASNGDGDDNDQSRIKRGFEIAPVHLNLNGKNRDLVGLGSYIVNAMTACNDCHATSATTEFTAGGNPAFGQPKQVNPNGYLGGGRDFGPLIPGTPHIISRNLTPDISGKPAGGQSFSDFLKIMRTGIDFDHLHPTCSGTNTKNCLPPPFDGNVLQIMPWYLFQDMTDHEMRAIYEYLSAVPCVAGPPAPNVLHNDCP